MTKQEAIELENKCDKLMSKCIGQDCTVSLALTGRLKIEFDNNYIILSKDFKTAFYIKFNGYYEDMKSYIKFIVNCVNENTEIFDRLIWSYEHITELE